MKSMKSVRWGVRCGSGKLGGAPKSPIDPLNVNKFTLARAERQSCRSRGSRKILSPFGKRRRACWISMWHCFNSNLRWHTSGKNTHVIALQDNALRLKNYWTSASWCFDLWAERITNHQTLKERFVTPHNGNLDVVRKTYFCDWEW